MKLFQEDEEKGLYYAPCATHGFLFFLNVRWHITSQFFAIKKKTVSHVSIFYQILNGNDHFDHGFKNRTGPTGSIMNRTLVRSDSS
jgi:hypothetical protein